MCFFFSPRFLFIFSVSPLFLFLLLSFIILSGILPFIPLSDIFPDFPGLLACYPPRFTILSSAAFCFAISLATVAFSLSSWALAFWAASAAFFAALAARSDSETFGV